MFAESTMPPDKVINFSDMLMCDVFAVANLNSNDLQVMSLPVHALHRADASFHALVICFYKFL